MDANRQSDTRIGRAGLRAAVLTILLLPFLTSCHVMTMRVGMGSNGVHQETMQQYYLFFGAIRLNEVDIQRVVGDLNSYDIEIGFSYRDGFWASVGDFLVSTLFLPLTVTRQAVTVKY